MIYQYLPPLDEDQRHALRQSIEANGILQPIEVDEDGNILDGHHRSEIARELGVECPTRVVAGLDENGKRKYAVTVNLMRRQMSPTVRGALVAQLRTEGMSVRRIADETGIPKSTVERDLSRVPHGTPDEITGADGKRYAATRPTDHPQLGVGEEPTPGLVAERETASKAPAGQRPAGAGDPLPAQIAERVEQRLAELAEERANREALYAPPEVVDAVNAATHFVPAMVAIQSACEDLIHRVREFDPERAVADLPDDLRARLAVARDAHQYLTRVVDALDRIGVPA